MLLLAALLAAPFVDTQERFTIDLPAGWKFTPQPGDTLGATFQRDMEGVLGHVFVKVLPAGEGIELGAYVARLAAAVESEPGYRLLANELDILSGLPAVRRRYVVFINGDPKWPKMAEDRVALSGNKAYVLHAETLAEAYGNFEDELSAMFASFRVKGAAPVATRPKDAGASLAGRWLMAEDTSTVFDLKKDGTFDLAGTPGVWKVQDDALVLLTPGGSEERFRWKLRGGELELTGAGLTEPIRYVRPGGGDKPTGKWKSAEHTLHLAPSGAATLDKEGGRWTLEDGAIVLKLGRDKRRVVLSYRIEAGKLYVTGGPFASEQALERAP
jgi:hypothetical protein